MTLPGRDEQRERLKSRLLAALASRVGRDRAIGMAELHEHVFEVPVKHRINDTRGTRSLVKELRRGGFMIVSNSTGYWTAANADEFRLYKRMKRHRAISELKDLADMERISYGDLLGQMKMDFERGDDDGSD